MANPDHMLDLGRNYTTKLSLVAAVVPFGWVQIEPAFPIRPNAYVHLRGGLGILPVYTDMDEVADYMDTEVPVQMVALSPAAWCARDEMIAIMPPEAYDEATHEQANREAGFLVQSFVRIATNGLVFPCMYDPATMAGEMQRGIAGYFGE